MYTPRSVIGRRIDLAVMIAVAALVQTLALPATAAPGRQEAEDTRPALAFSTYYGGPGWERATDMARDAAGNLYILGTGMWHKLPDQGTA